MNQLQDFSATNLPDPLMEVNEMLTMPLFNVQRELKSTVTPQVLPNDLRAFACCTYMVVSSLPKYLKVLTVYFRNGGLSWHIDETVYTYNQPSCQ